MKRYFPIFACASLVLLGLAGFGAWRAVTPQHDACDPSAYPSNIPCYMHEVQRTIRQHGLSAGTAFVADVRPQLNYGVGHLMMHEVGRQAYLQLGSLAKGLAYQTDHFADTVFDFEIDGYRHGLFQAYFSEHPNQAPHELITAACADFLDDVRNETPDQIHYPVPRVSDAEHDANQCFHGVGHAFMYAYENDVHRALSACDTSPHQWQREWCYYGSFMEYLYTYWPEYEPEFPRQFVGDGRMTSLCTSVPKHQQRACSFLAGRGSNMAKASHLNHDTVSTPFDACFLVPDAYREGCIVEAAAFSLPRRFGSDPTRVFEPCDTLDSQYQYACVYGGAAGWEIGTGGFYDTDENICTFASDDSKTACTDGLTTGRGYVFF